MAFRRRMGGLAELLLRQHLAQQNQENASRLAFEREQQSKVADLGYAEAMKHAGEGGDLGDVPTSVMAAIGPLLKIARPSIEDVAGKVGGQLQSAKTLTDLPTDMGAALRAASPKFTDLQGISTPAQDDAEQQKQAPFKQPGAASDYAFSAPSGAAPSINALMQQRAERERALLADIQRQAQQKATEAGMVTHETALANEAPDVAGLKRTNFKAMTPLETARAGAVSGAQHAAAQPYSTPQTLFDKEGGVHQYRYGPKGAQEVPGLPPGMTTEKPQRLGGAQIDELSLLNSAETEGVKVLAKLHKAGLDSSNDPLDPRWTKFVAQTLQMAPSDFNKADIVQRTQFIHAAILRSIMGGRPNQYIAQLYAAHTPEAGQTGEQLTHVLTNVLEQAQSRRSEMEHLTGHAAGFFGPSSGVTYHQYKDMLANEPQGPQQLDPSIEALLNRSKGRRP